MANRIDSIADRLFRARTTGCAIPPPSETMALVNLDEAYLVQRHNNQRRAEGGDQPIGRKVGLTSKAAQQQFGVDQPDMGLLFRSTCFDAGAEIPTAGLMSPKVEAELAFRLAADIDALPDSEAKTMDLVAAAVRAVVPALEIVDSRICNWRVTLADTVADNASGWGVVVGGPERPLAGLDAAAVTMCLRKNGEVASEGTGAAVLGNPLAALCWAARQAIRLGSPLRAGELVLTGAMGPAAPLAAGDRFLAEIDDFPPLAVCFVR